MKSDIVDILDNSFKQSTLFEKIKKIERFGIVITAFITITSIVSISTLYIQIKNYNKQLILERDILYKLKTKCGELQNTYNLLLNEQQNINAHLQLEYNKLFDKITSLEKMYLNIPFSPINCNDSNSEIQSHFIENKNAIQENNIEVTKTINQILVNDDELLNDDELFNECYDMVPLNNLKKTTGLSWLFK